LEWTQTEPFLKAKVEILPPLKVIDPDQVEALRRNIQSMIQEALALLPQIPPEIRAVVMERRTQHG